MNGWAIGSDADLGTQVADRDDAESLYATLESEIIPLYYDRNPEDLPINWLARVRESLRTVTPQFSTRRMVKEYIERLYLPAMPELAKKRKK
jgi:starch phosphorylase